MTSPDSRSAAGQLRLLVGIASFGNRNIDYLRRIIATYHRMPLAVDIVVFSDGPKDLGPGVKVLVGLPTRNSWSLPFAHKSFFADNVHRYDLFAYSEDDVEVTHEHIEAFLEATPALEKDEIAGYLLYEVDERGTWSMPNVHGPFHWKPESVRHRGAYVIAEFTNDHSAFYLLTQQQLERCLASGGYLRQPYEGRYDMLCTASTDPYTSCGFRKVICVSHLRRFLLHHLPNRYRRTFRPSLGSFEEQVQTLLAIGQGQHPAATLCEVESQYDGSRWSKDYYEETNEAVLNSIPPHSGTILSIGCGWGNTEAELIKRGAQVAALPLDSVIGTHAAGRGIEIINGSLNEGLARVEDRRFDCILVANLLHLVEGHTELINKCAGLLEHDGTLILTGPNPDYLPVAFARVVRPAAYGQGSRGNVLTIVRLFEVLKKAQLSADGIIWQVPPRTVPVSGSTKLSRWPRRVVSQLWNKAGRLAASRTRSDIDWASRLLTQSWIVRARSRQSHVSRSTKQSEPVAVSNS